MKKIALLQMAIQTALLAFFMLVFGQFDVGSNVVNWARGVKTEWDYNGDILVTMKCDTLCRNHEVVPAMSEYCKSRGIKSWDLYDANGWAITGTVAQKENATYFKFTCNKK